ncbi:hypothetical protein CerSpe_047720 [Prunus speciosa]
MADQSRHVTLKLQDHDQSAAPPSSLRLTGKFLTAGAAGTILLVLFGLTLTGTVMALIMATPVLVVFSPILVPAGIVVFLTAAGLVFSGGCGVAAITTLTLMYKYISSYVATKKRAYLYGQYFSPF